MKIENVFLRAFIIALIGSIVFFVIGLFFGKSPLSLWKLTLVYFFIMMLAIIGKHFIKRQYS